jgi:rhodanese-related sulfurtransferase
MQRFFEYLAHHPYLSGGAVVMAILVLVNELRERVQTYAAVSAMQAVQMMNQGALVLDVRGKDLFDAGHIGDARNISVAELDARAESLKKWRDRNVIVYCDSGVSAAGAAKALTRLGFSKVFNLAGGIDGWRKENLPVVKGSPAGKQGAR